MHNTGNPLGSTQVLDLYDNSEVVDQFTNSQQDEIPDRFGVKRLTLAGLIKRSMGLRNEINDFSGSLTFKPEWTDVPMNISEGVGGEGGPLNLQAEALGNRSEINKITSREALRHSCAEAGYTLVPGSFEVGGTLVNSNDVLLQESTGKAFSGPAGTVPAGTNPASGGFTDQSGKLLRPEITGRYVYVGRSLYDVLTEAERARVIANDSTFDLTAKIQSLIDQTGTFYLMVGCNHYCNGSLRIKSYSKMLGSVPATNKDAGKTRILFNEATTSVGVYLNNIGVDTFDWAIEGIGLKPRNAAISSGFRVLKVDPAGGQSYGFRLFADISRAHTGIDIGRPLWGGEINLHIRYCYKSFQQSLGTENNTSLSGWLKVSDCFHGPVLDGLVYSDLNVWTQQIGLTASADIIADSPTNETPICLTLRRTVALKLTWGVEDCKAQLLNASSYSTADISLMYFNSPSSIFVKDPVRISNVPLAEQSVVFLRAGSQINLSNMVCGWTDVAGYPAPLADPTYFYNSADTGDRCRLNLSGCFITMNSYRFVPNDTKYAEVYAEPERNVIIGFYPNQYKQVTPTKITLGKTPWLQLGSTTTLSSHQLFSHKAHSEGQLIMTISGQEGVANPVTFHDANGGFANAANAAMKLTQASSTGRSINAKGTVNTSGADYAEYMVKADGCGEIAKGDICGVNHDGLLTDKFDDAIAFVVKSTDPSYVGGDTWFYEQEPVEPSTDASEEVIAEYMAAKAAFGTRLEAARQRVDRIAFSGQVPCNVLGAKPGDYILPVRQSDGTISGVAVTNPDFSQYQLCVGKVWKVRDNGMAWISIKIG